MPSTQNRRPQGTSTTGKSAPRKSAGRKTAGTAKKRSAGRTRKSSVKRRQIWGFVFILLALLGLLSLIKADGNVVHWYNNVTAGLVGRGHYLLIAAFIGAAALLFTKKRGALRLRIFCMIAIPVLYGALCHVFTDSATYEFSIEGIAQLYTNGVQLKSGGIIAGAIGILFKSGLDTVGAVIVLILLLIAALLVTFNLTVFKVIDFFKGLSGRLYDDEEEYEEDEEDETEIVPAVVQKTRRRPQVDIPLDDTPPPKEAARGKSFGEKFTFNPPNVKTPAEVLAAGGFAAENAAAPAAPDAPETPEIQAGLLGDEPPEEVKNALKDMAPLKAEPERAGENARADGEKEADKAETDKEIARTLDNSLKTGSMENEYKYPPLTLLAQGSEGKKDYTAELQEHSSRLIDTLKSFGIEARIVSITRGPSVTRYEIQLSRGVKFSRLTGLSEDIALSLGAPSIRIAPIPDKVAIGVEVPNQAVQTVRIREVLSSGTFKASKSKISFAVGKDITGQCVVGDIMKMPHMLIAGTTGSGKSVCINSMLISLLYKSTPDEVRLIMIDPKMIELGIYNGIPHLLIPVVTDPKKASGALNWAVSEMMRRYKLFSEHNVRDLAAYNEVVKKTEDGQTLPQIVIVIDELADLMFVAAHEVEEAVARIAQMARAAGMHLVIATQRPSADVITGIMKANIPSRIAFAVASQIESRIILDTMGAEKLIGRGDMLYYPLGSSKPQRVQGCFITSEEIEAVIEFIKSQGKADYSEEVIEHIERQAAESGSGANGGASDGGEDADELLPRAIEVVVETGQASVSMLQRRLKLGYSRAARLIDQMEERGIVGPFEGSKPRQVLITRDEWKEMVLRQSEQ